MCQRACGVATSLQCSDNLVCVGDGCDPQDRDCVGVCKEPPFCGGIAALQCPPGLVCVDDKDECDPTTGGADCGGICVEPDD